MATPTLATRSTAASAAAVAVSIVVPTLNEAANVAPLHAALGQAMRTAGHESYEILFVDGQSSDETAAHVGRLISQSRHVRLLVREDRNSLSAAVIDGFGHTSGAHIVVMDADLQHPPDVVPRLLAALADGADIAVGSRYVPGGDSRLGLLRSLFSRTCTRLVRVCLGSRFAVFDPLSGFFAVRRSVIANRRLTGSGFKILMEVLACGDYRDVREIPYRFEQRVRGESKLGLRTALRDVAGLVRAARAFRRRTNLR